MLLDDVAKSVRAALRWMQRTQCRDGHWQADDALSRIHGTTRCVRAFHGAGFPGDYPTVSRATRWLLRPEVDGGSVYHYFWRLGALSELPSIPAASLNHDFEVVQQAVASGIGLDTRLNYHAFLLDCAANCGRGALYAKEAAELESRLGVTITDATPVLWGYVALERAGYKPSDNLKRYTVQRLFESLQDQAGSQHLSGLTTATSFVIFNVSRSPSLSQEPRVATAVLNCVKWLLVRQCKSGAWPLEPPLYNNDPRCEAYFTGVAARGLAEYLRRYAPTHLAHVFLPDWLFRHVLSAVFRWALVIGVSIGLALLAYALIPGRTGILIAGLGLVASLIEIGVFAVHARAKLRRV